MVSASSFNWKACVFAPDSSLETCSESGPAALRAGDITIIPAATRATIAGTIFSTFFIKFSFLAKDKLRDHYDVVDDAGHSRGGPCRAFRFFLFEPGADVPVESYRAVLRGNGNSPRIDLRASPQRVFDFGFHLRRRGLWFHFDLVGDAPDAIHFPRGAFGGIPLIMPVGCSFQRHKAVLNAGLDSLVGDHDVQLQCMHDVARHFGIAAGHRLHLDVVSHRSDAVNGFGGLLGRELFGVAVNEAGERHHAFGHADANILRINFGSPIELPEHGFPKFLGPDLFHNALHVNSPFVNGKRARRGAWRRVAEPPQLRTSQPRVTSDVS